MGPSNPKNPIATLPAEIVICLISNGKPNVFPKNDAIPRKKPIEMLPAIDPNLFSTVLNNYLISFFQDYDVKLEVI